MKKNLLTGILIIAILGFQRVTFAQYTLPPDQPEQDACSALQICGNFYTPYSYQGVGLVTDVYNTPCGGNETNSVFFLLDVNTAGTIEFQIVPNDSVDDYDFAVIDISNGSCNNISQSQIIRCNFNNNEQPNNYYYGGIVGLNATATSNTAYAGVYGQAFVQQITANAGDQYLIMINNYGHDNCFGSCPGSGFTLDFTGSTATFNQPPPPQFDSIVPQCDNSQTITIILTQNALCGSIAPDGSDFYLTPTGTVQSAQGLGCSGTQGYTKKVKLTFNGTLPYGAYYVHAQQGTDTNTLLGVCQNQLAVPDSLPFFVVNNAIHLSSIDNPACQTLTVHTSSPILCTSVATDGSDFHITGPSPVTVNSAAPLNCTNGFTQTVAVHIAQPIPVDGVYELIAQTGSDGNTLVDDCNNSVPPGDQTPFTVNSYNGLLSAGPDTNTCLHVVSFYVVNNSTPPSSGFNYTWTPTTGILNPNDPSSQVILTPGHHKWVLSTIDAAGCYLRDSVVINKENFEGAVTPTDATVCYGIPLPLSATGGVSFQWSDNSALTDTSADLSCGFCPNPKVLASVGDHYYYVKITNDIGCTDIFSTLVHVLPSPIITANPADTTINYGKSVTLNAFGGITYTWTPEGSLNDPLSPSPVATPKKSTTYTVTGMNASGCTAKDSSRVTINFRSPVFIPNAFSPNGDGTNDIFSLKHLTFQKVLTFDIFDRWGNLVFHTNNPKQGWDGTFNGKPSPSGTYYYLIKLGYPDNYQQTFKGSVTLIR